MRNIIPLTMGLFLIAGVLILISNLFILLLLLQSGLH